MTARDDAMDCLRNARYARAATLPFWEAAAARLPATRSQPMSQSVLTHLLTLLTANELRPKGLQATLQSLAYSATMQRPHAMMRMTHAHDRAHAPSIPHGLGTG